MQAQDLPAQDATSPWRPRWWLSAANRALRSIALGGRERDPASTLDRFFTSQHVKDLRAIVAVAFCAVVAVMLLGFSFTLENQIAKHSAEAATATSDKHLWHLTDTHLIIATVASFLTFFAPILAAFAALVAWAYQTGSARLGVVDLFACEVSTLCRVVTVIDAVPRIIERFKRAEEIAHADQAAPAPAAHGALPQFASQEEYFPVFAGNARDLQTLEARVVINITAFYTFMKAMRDSMRTMAEIGAPTKDTAGAAREAARNVIYMLYLGLESARRAIVSLVEFEPEKAERTVVILISELKAYSFLRSQYSDGEDSHFQRLAMRETEYRDVVPRLCDRIKQGKDKEDAARTHIHWQPAWLLVPQLRECYAKAIGAA